MDARVPFTCAIGATATAAAAALLFQDCRSELQHHAYETYRVSMERASEMLAYYYRKSIR